MKKLGKSIALLLLMFFASCNSNDENKTQLSFPELLTVLSPEEAYIYFFDREVDHSKTASCGTATPSSGTDSTTTATSNSTVSRQTTGETSNTRFTIFSQLIMRYTEEVLTLKYTYDMNQTQGSIDPQQGFILTGDLYQRTITGTAGLVEWNNQGIGYISSSGSGAQTLSFFEIDVNLTGTYVDNSSTTTTQPFQCPTLDNQSCEYGQVTNGKTCFTTDNLTCIVNSASGTTVTITGTIKCNAENIVPN
ncbi:MAG: hypothetical protein AAF518_23835 [Spirochaetota bacterium]